MTETTKIVTKTVLATSLLGIAFVAGLFTFFPSIKAELVHLLEQKTQVAGRDTPVIIRGGSIVARAKTNNGWQQIDPTDPTKGYFTNVGLACRKNQIFVSGQDLNDSTIDESNSPWEIDVSSRKNDGMQRPMPNSGLRICSEVKCNLASRNLSDTNVYMYVLDNDNDAINDPDVDDDDPPAKRGLHLKKYQRCEQCDFISKVYVLDTAHPTAATPTAPSPFVCNNSDCRVHIGKDEGIKCPL